MHQPVEHGVGQGGVADGLMPAGNRQLARHHRGAIAVAIFEDLQQIASMSVGERMQTPVVEHQDIDPGQTGQDLAVAPVGLG